MMAAKAAHADPAWHVGQIVEVNPRTWANINRQGGRGRVTRVYEDEKTGKVESLDVKYVLGGYDKAVEIHHVSVVKDEEEPGRGRRQRRSVVSNKTTTTPRGKTAGHVSPGSKKRTTKGQTDENIQNGAAGVPAAAKIPKGRKPRTDEPVISDIVPAEIVVSSTKKKGAKGSKTTRNVPAKPAARRKLAASPAPKKPAAVATPLVPREIIVRRMKDGASSGSVSDSFASPLSELGDTPRRYMLAQSARRQLSASTTPVHTGGSACRSRLFQSGGKPSPSCYSTTKSNVSKRSHNRLLKGGTTPLSKKAKSTPSPPDRTPGSANFPKATLLSEHARAMDDASRFIEEVTGRDKEAAEHDDNEMEISPLAGDSLFFAFFRALHVFLDQHEGEEISEDALADYLNDGDAKFSAAQTKEFLDRLCRENKIMRSGEHIYLVE